VRGCGLSAGAGRCRFVARLAVWVVLLVDPSGARAASVGDAGRPAREVWVELPSHDDVVHLAGHLAARGWRVRPRRRHLIVGADCEDDAESLARELSGDGPADADTAFRVRRVDIYAPWPGGDAFG
jgi:hypothetical protein